MNEIKSINNMPLHDTIARTSIIELEDKINNIEDNIDLSGYALKTDIKTKTSQLINDSGFLTNIPTEYITEEELANMNYALKTDIKTKTSQLTNDSGFLTSIPTEYVTEEEINELLKNINTEGDLIHVFLTQEEYDVLTEEEKNNDSKLYMITGAEEVVLSEYITESELTAKNYATTSYVDNLIGDVGALLDTLNGEIV